MDTSAATKVDQSPTMSLLHDRLPLGPCPRSRCRIEVEARNRRSTNSSTPTSDGMQPCRLWVELRGSDPQFASYLRIEERELEAGG